MIKFVIEAAQNSSIEKNVVVLGHGRDKVEENIKDYGIIAVEQPIGKGLPYGTGYAVMCTDEYIDEDDTVIILCGDGPLITKETLTSFMKYHEENNYAASVLTCFFDNPKGYGRIVRSEDNSINNIIEEKDASDEVKSIKEINTGIFCFKGNMLKKLLK